MQYLARMKTTLFVFLLPIWYDCFCQEPFNKKNINPKNLIELGVPIANYLDQSGFNYSHNDYFPRLPVLSIKYSRILYKNMGVAFKTYFIGHGWYLPNLVAAGNNRYLTSLLLFSSLIIFAQRLCSIFSSV